MQHSLLVGQDNDMLARIRHCDDARVAVWLTTVVNESRGVALHCSINHPVRINAEHEAIHMGLLIAPLPLLTYNRANHFSQILNDNLIFREASHGKEATAVNARPIDIHIAAPPAGMQSKASGQWLGYQLGLARTNATATAVVVFESALRGHEEGAHFVDGAQQEAEGFVQSPGLAGVGLDSRTASFAGNRWSVLQVKA